MREFANQKERGSIQTPYLRNSSSSLYHATQNTAQILRRTNSKDGYGSVFIDSEDGVSKKSKTKIYMELIESKFPESYKHFFNGDKKKFSEYLSQCSYIAGESGMATVDVLLLSFFSRENDLAIIFRPINLKTRDQMKVQDSTGKDSSISLKSSNFGPIEGCIPRYSGLSKLAERFNQNEIDVKENNISIEIKLKETLSVIEEVRVKEQIASENEIINQKFLVSVPKIIEHDKVEYELFFFPDKTNPIKARCDEESRPYFVIKKEEKLLFYNYENKKYEEIVGNKGFLISDAKEVEVLAYRSYKPLKDDKFGVETGSLLRYEATEKAIIPDYDIYSLGNKRIFNKEALLEDSQKQSEFISETISEPQILAKIEFEKLMESLRFDKIDKMSTVSYVHIEMIKKLQELTEGQVNHGAETTNSNTQDLSNQNGLLFAWKDSDKVSTKSLKSAVIIFKENEDDVVRTLNQVRDWGYFIDIGSRWGFEVDRENGNVSSFNHDSKIKHWKERAIEEKKLIGTLKDCCKSLYFQGVEGDFKKALEAFSEKFESKKNRRFIKSEYFSEEEIANPVSQSTESKDIAESKVEMLIDKLDIIAQEEKIRQLELAPALIYCNYQELSDSDKKIADLAKIEYEKIIKKEILGRKKSLEEATFSFSTKSQFFIENKDFYEIIASIDPIKENSTKIVLDVLKEGVTNFQSEVASPFLNNSIDFTIEIEPSKSYNSFNFCTALSTCCGVFADKKEDNEIDELSNNVGQNGDLRNPVGRGITEKPKTINFR
jgi:hypothetical protein